MAYYARGLRRASSVILSSRPNCPHFWLRQSWECPCVPVQPRHGGGDAGEGVGSCAIVQGPVSPLFPGGLLVLPVAHHPCQQKDRLTHSFCVKRSNLRTEKPPAVIKCVSYHQHGTLCSTSSSMAEVSAQTRLWSRDHLLPRASSHYQPARGLWEAEENRGGYLGIQRRGCAPGECKPLLTTAPFSRPGERQLCFLPSGLLPHGAPSHHFGGEGRLKGKKKEKR